MLRYPKNLTLAVLVHLNVQKLPDVKLPRVLVDRLYLNRHMSAILTRRDDVVMRDVSSKRCCEEAATAQFRRYQKFADCARQFGSLTCRHT